MEVLHFAYVLRVARPGMIDESTATEEAALERHFVYLQQALDAGQIVLAGPCLDGAFGIVIFTAASPAAANDFMQRDPAVQEGIMTAELHPFHISLMAGYPA